MTARNATPRITPIARSSALPLRMNSRNSLSMTCLQACAVHRACQEDLRGCNDTNAPYDGRCRAPTTLRTPLRACSEISTRSVGLEQAIGDRQLAELRLQLLEPLASGGRGACDIGVLELVVCEHLGDVVPAQVAIDAKLQQLAVVFLETITQRADAVLHLRPQ